MAGGQAGLGGRIDVVGGLIPRAVPTVGVALLNPLRRNQALANVGAAIVDVAERAQQLPVELRVVEPDLHAVLFAARMYRWSSRLWGCSFAVSTDDEPVCLGQDGQW